MTKAFVRTVSSTRFDVRRVPGYPVYTQYGRDDKSELIYSFSSKKEAQQYRDSINKPKQQQLDNGPNKERPTWRR